MTCIDAGHAAEIPPGGYVVEEICGGLHWVGDGVYNAMFLVHDSGIILVDAPPALGANHMRAIRDVSDKPVTHMVYSHSHGDHIGGAHALVDGAEIIAHAETAATLARRRDRARPMPTLVFDTPHHVLEVGGQRLELDYHGINHEVGNLFIHAPAQRVLMLVDVIYPGWVPFNRLGMAHDVQGYIEAHDHVLAYDFDTFIGGHIRPGKRADVEIARAYILDLRSAIETAFASVDPAEQAKATGTRNTWRMANAYFDAVVEHAAAALRPRWKGRLAGFEDCIYENAFRMLTGVAVELPAMPE